MEMFGKIRRMYLRDKLSLHEITKRTGLSRNTIRKWLRASEKVAPPTYRRSKEPGKLNAFHATLEQAIKADFHRPKQNRRTAKDLLAQIKADGYTGGYSQLTAFIRNWRGTEGKKPHAFVPLRFELGEAFQFEPSFLLCKAFDTHHQSLNVCNGQAGFDAELTRYFPQYLG